MTNAPIPERAGVSSVWAFGFQGTTVTSSPILRMPRLVNGIKNMVATSKHPQF